MGKHHFSTASELFSSMFIRLTGEFPLDRGLAYKGVHHA